MLFPLLLFPAAARPLRASPLLLPPPEAELPAVAAAAAAAAAVAAASRQSAAAAAAEGPTAEKAAAAAAPRRAATQTPAAAAAAPPPRQRPGRACSSSAPACARRRRAKTTLRRPRSATRSPRPWTLCLSRSGTSSRPSTPLPLPPRPRWTERRRCCGRRITSAPTHTLSSLVSFTTPTMKLQRRRNAHWESRSDFPQTK